MFDPRPSASPLRGLARVLLSTLAGLLLAELAGRALLPLPYGNLRTNLTCDAALGWRGLLNETYEYGTDGYYLHKVTWNSRGFVDRERSLAKPPGVFRVLVLGDSMLEGAEVEGSRTWRAVLEEILNLDPAPGRRVEVMAAGVGGWSPAQQLLYFETEGRRYQPDLVVPLFNPRDDLGDMIPGRRLTAEFNCYSPSFVLCGGTLCPEPVYSAPGLALWSDCSALSRRLSSILSGLYRSSRVWQTAEARGLNIAWPRLPDAYSPFTDKARADPLVESLYRLTVDVYSRLAKAASGAGAATVFSIVPFKDAVLFEADERYRERFVKQSPHLQGMDPRLPNRVFRELMEAKGHAVVDLHDVFAGEGPQAKALFWEVDIHYSPLGHQRMAEGLASRLLQRGLVPVAAHADTRLPTPRSILHRDVRGWNIVGYDVDEEALFRGEPLDVRIHWLVPEGVEPRPSADFQTLKGRRFVQVVRGARSLVRNGGFESGAPDATLPFETRGRTGLPWLGSVSETREGGPTRVAVLRTTAEVKEVGFASEPVPVEPDRLYLLAGAMRAESASGLLGVQWMPQGVEEYFMTSQPGAAWGRRGTLIVPPRAATEARIALLSTGGAGAVYVDDLALLELGKVGAGSPPLLAIPPNESSGAMRPRVTVSLDVMGWRLHGYDADEERLARGEPADVTLHWIAPPGGPLRPSSAFRRLTGSRWLQVVPQVRSLLPDGAFERGLAGFPQEMYGAPPSSRAVVPDLRAGKTTAVAVLQNSDHVRRSSLVSARITVHEDRLYLQTGWTRTRAGQTHMGRQWLPGGAFGYSVAEASPEAWEQHAEALRPPPGSRAAQVWLLNYESTGRTYFDDVVFVDLGRIDPGILVGGPASAASSTAPRP